MERREFSGAVVSTTLASNVSASDNFISLTDASTFPDGQGISGKPFVVVISRGSPNEEKVLVQNRDINDIFNLTRGYDGTMANTHTAGAIVDHVLDATVLQDMNNTTYNNEINIWMAV